MDPGETGRHGPWLVEIEGPDRVKATLLPMSKVRYDGVEIDLAGIATMDEFQSRVVGQTNQYLESNAGDGSPLEYVSLRLDFRGRTSVCSQLEDWTGRLLDDFEPRIGEVVARIDTVANNTLPAIDLDELAENRDPPGVLARTLKALESNRPDETVEGLVREARRKMLEVHDAVAYGGPIHQDRPPELEAARRQLIREAGLLLDRLLAQERSA
jgi:hypothetical protein